MTKNYFFVLAILSFFVTSAQQAGDLDATFGTNGIVKTNMWDATFNVKSHVVLSDGKTIVVGEVATGNEPRGFITRLLANGSVDTSFGTQGKVIHPFLGGINVVKIQTDGKIVVGSTYVNDFAVARYLANGTLDTGFAYDGTYYNTSPDPNSFPSHTVLDLEIQSDSKIVGLTTSQVSGANKFRLFRLNSNGIVDNTLNVNDNFGTNDTPVALSLQTDGKLVVTGYFYNGSSPNAFIARYNSNGTLDTSFNTTGKRSFSITNTTAIRVTDMQLQSDGKILMGGNYFSNGNAIFMIRFNTNGTFDTTFSGDGFQAAGLPAQLGRPGGIALQADGKIIQIDTYLNPTSQNEDILAIRYNTNGDLDTTFNNGSFGILLNFNNLNDVAASVSVVNNQLLITGNTETSRLDNSMVFAKFNLNPLVFDATFGDAGSIEHALSYPTYEEVKKSVVQSDNKVVLLTKIFVNNLYFYALQRFNEDGSPDATYGTNGKLGLGFYFTEFDGMGIDSNNNIILAGYTTLSSGLILRITPNGTLDSTFGTQGITYLEDDINFIPEINSIQIQNDGKIVLGGGNIVNNVIDYLLIRLNSNGTIDTSFGTNGISLIGLANVYEKIIDIKVLNDGKIVALGFSQENFASSLQAVILKFNSVGLLDPTFNGNGKYLTNREVDFYFNGALLVQNDGKILSTFESLEDNFIMYRLNANGTLDTNFGFGGYSTTYINGTDYSSQLYYNPSNQKITVIGTTLVNDEGRFVLARYEGNGLLDSTFGDSGVVITDLGYSAQAVSARATTDGKLVVSGILFDDVFQDYDQVMAKYYLEQPLSLNTPNTSQLTLYPNPTSELLFVELPNSVTDSSYQITDVSGKVVMKGKLNTQGIRVAALTNGVYFITVKGLQTTRFIKK